MMLVLRQKTMYIVIILYYKKGAIFANILIHSSSNLSTIMKGAAILFCLFSVVLAFPGETGPNCDGELSIIIFLILFRSYLKLMSNYSFIKAISVAMKNCVATSMETTFVLQLGKAATKANLKTLTSLKHLKQPKRKLFLEQWVTKIFLTILTIFILSSFFQDLKKQCARYTGNNVHNAHDCAVVCGQGGYSTYSYWPTFNICCCDCGNTPCFQNQYFRKIFISSIISYEIKVHA